MNDLTDLIQWDQGMLLTPKHFLELAGRCEILQQNLALLHSPFGWGVSKFASRLENGTVTVTELEAILPDGTFIAMRKGELKPFEPKREGKGEIHIAIPKRRDLAWREANARYKRRAPGLGIDDATADAIPRIRPRLELLEITEENEDKFVTLPLFRVTFEPAFQNDFEPPRLYVPHSSKLSEICSALVTLLRAKIRSLNTQLASSAQSPEKLPLLRERRNSLVAGLPQLETLQQSGRAHPFSLYLALCAIVGHVIPMADLQMVDDYSVDGPMAEEPAARVAEPPDFRTRYAYDHNDLLACFRKTVDYIKAAVEHAVSDRWASFPLDPAPEGGFRLPVRPELESSERPRLVIGLRPAPGQEPIRTVAWGMACFVGTGDDEEVLKKRQTRVTGATRKPLPDPVDLTPPPGFLLFEIDEKDVSLDLKQVLHLVGPTGAIRPDRAILFVRQSLNDRRGEG